ncbi:MAG: UbiA family prenyltransferase [Thermoplasmatota archaeon]
MSDSNGMMHPVVRMIRPLNSLMSSFSIPIVMITLFGFDIFGPTMLIHTVIGMAIVFLFTSAGNILNDYMDREVDKFNHPKRPIPSGEVRPKEALIYSVGMFIVAILISAFLPFYLPQIIVLSAIILLISYEWRFKKSGLTGNIIISFLTGLVFVFGGAIYGKLYLPAILGLLAMLASVGREITKDIQDMKGDLDRKTFPMRVGKGKAQYTVILFVATAVFLSPLPYIENLLSESYLIIVVLADIIFIYSLLILEDAEKSQKFNKTGMIIALIAFLVGGIL